MRKVLALVALTFGCGDSGGSSGDGGGGGADGPAGFDANPADARIVGGYDFSCMGTLPPGTAPDPLAISGTIREGQSMSPSSGASLETHRVGDDSQVGQTATSGGNGSISSSLPTGGQALNVYLLLRKGGLVDNYVYPPEPLYRDIPTFSNVLVSQSDLELAATFAGAPSPDSGAGTFGVVIMDCAERPIVGATVSFSPAAEAVGYTDGSFTSTSATATANDGLAIGFNVPAGTVTVGGSFMGVPLASHAVQGHGGAITQTIVHP